MRITEAEQEARKSRMIHTAYELFCEYGIDGVSIAQIAKAAGVSSNSVFRYFDSKVQLVQSTQKILWGEIATHLLENSEQQVADAKNGLQEMEILLLNFKVLYEKYSKYILFAYDSKLFFVRNRITLTEQVYQEMLSPIRQAFVGSLEKGQRDGSISTSESPDTQFVSLWCVMRSYTDAAILYEKVYKGKNPWKVEFCTVLQYINKVLRTKA